MMATIQGQSEERPDVDSGSGVCLVKILLKGVMDCLDA